MRIDVSQPVVQCDCDTCVQHRTLFTNTQETEPTNVIGASVTSVPVSPGPAQPLGPTSDQSSGTETTPLAPPPPVTAPVNPEPAAQSVDDDDDTHDDASSKSSPVQTSSPPPTIISSPPAPGCPPPFPTSGPSTSSSSSQATVTNLVGSPPSRPSRWGPPLQAPTPFSSTASTTSSTLSPFVRPSQHLYRWGPPVQAPPPPPFSSTASTSSTLSRLVTPSDLLRWGPRVQAPVQTTTPKNPFPGFSVDYLPRCPSNLVGPNPQTSTPVPPGLSPFWTEQGSRYPPYAPTPDVNGMRLMSISASDSHGHKSHEELRWEDYKNGDKGDVVSFPPPAHKSRKESRWDQDYKYGDKDGLPWYLRPDHTPSIFAPPIRPAFRSPHEPLGLSSTTYGFCTACGATSSSSTSTHLGLNGTTTNPSSSATSLPGLFFPTYGSFPLLFATPAVQAYPMMFGIPNLVSQGTTTTPAAQPYPTMFGTPSLAAQGTTTAPAAQPYPTMFGSPSLAAQGTTTTPATQPYPPMFGTPNLGAQGITPAAQAYPTNGLNVLPFSDMSLQ